MKAVSLQDHLPPPPLHVAIIMDGNGRWAQFHGLPRTSGHRRGAEAVRTVIKSAVDCGVTYLTLYGFSSENWRRPADEVNDLMGLLRFYLRSEIANLEKNGVRLRIIGESGRLAPDIVKLIELAERKTAGNTKLTLTIALSYGGRAEITAAARRLAEEVKAGILGARDIDDEAFAGRLFTAGMPDPDLLIRCSGEMRTSNFLPWQMVYTEIWFTPVYWPEFLRHHLYEAIRAYQQRHRRFGGA